MAEILWSWSKDLEVILKGRNKDHIIEDNDIVLLLSNFDPIDQLLVGSCAQAEDLLADRQNLIELYCQFVHLGGCVDGAKYQVLKRALEEQFLWRFQGLLEDQITQVFDDLFLVELPTKEMNLKGRLMHQPFEKTVLTLLVLLWNDFNEFLAAPQASIDEASLYRE